MKKKLKRLIGLTAAAALLLGITPAAGVFAADSEPENLLLGDSVVRSGDVNEGGKNSTNSANIFDGNIDTEYNSWGFSKDSEKNYIFDLGEAKQFDQVTVYLGKTDIKNIYLTLSYSDSIDGTYVTVFENAYIPSVKATTVCEQYVLNFAPVTAQCVKFTVTHGDNNNISIAEIQLANAGEQSENLLYHRPILKSTIPSVSANLGAVSKMFDGDETTEIQTYSGTPPYEITLDLGEKRLFNHLKVRSAKGNNRTHDIGVEVSDDNVTFSPATTSETCLHTDGGGNKWFETKFPAARGRYVKLVFDNYIAPNPDGRVSLSEIQLYDSTDKIPPVITLEGSENIMLELGEEYVEPGYTATDNEDGDITSQVVVSGADEINVQQKGVYYVKYNVSDAMGNAAEEKVRTVSVGLDVTPPVITLKGEAEMYVITGDSYTEPGYTAEDNADGDLTASVVVGGDSVDTQKAGVYVITYNVSDESGNAAEEKTRTVTVGPDITPPVITLRGETEMDVFAGESYDEPGYTAVDNKDGDLTASVVVGGDSVDTSVPGTYEITYTVTDAAGNRAQAVRTVKVIAVEYNTDFCIGANIVTGDSGGSQSTKVSNMFDGDKATRFRSWQNKDGCTGEHILDLGAAKQFNQLVVVQAADTARLFTLTLQIGETASGPWSNVIDPVDIPKVDGGVTTRNFDPISARYVRFYIDKVEPGQDFYNIAELQLLMDEASYKISKDLKALTLPSKTGADLALPAAGSYGSGIVWTSSHPALMDAAGKVVKRPEALEGEKTVHLTAALTFGEVTQTAEFDVTVTPKNIVEDASLSGMENAANLNDANYTTTAVLADQSELEAVFASKQLLSKAEFALQGENGLTAIEVLAWNGSSYASLGVQTPTETEGVLAIEFPCGEYEKLKFRFTGSASAAEMMLGLTDEDAVNYLAERLTVSDEPLRQITKDLILSSRGEHGQTVAWSSNNTAVVRNNGSVIRPNQDTDVRMTAVVTKGESSKTVYFDITVLQKTSGGSFGPGSGSGGGRGTSGRGSSDGQITAPITTPAPLPENNPAEPGKPGAAVGDMDASHWAYTYVEQLKKAGIVSGDENGNFEPERTITRAEYMKMLAAAFALTGEAEAFDDVAADAWYLPYITAARANGIVLGDEKNYAHPEAEITRQDMAVMLGRALEAKGLVPAQKRDYQEFADQAAISEYAAVYTKAIYCSGVIDGMGNGAFEPQGLATRAQAAKIIAVALKEG